MARQLGSTACQVETSQLVEVVAERSRVDGIPADFFRLGTGRKPVAVFLGDFFSGAVPADLERIAPARGAIDTFNRQTIRTEDLNPASVVQSDRPRLQQSGIGCR